MLTADIIIADRTTPMDELLQEAGWSFTMPGPIRCPVHGGGQEQHPSAKIFGPHDTIYCFACSRQFRPTEVAAALWSMERHEAAAELLKKWPGTKEQQQAALREASEQKQPTILEIYHIQTEKALRKYKRRIPLAVYRTWALKVDTFIRDLLEIPEQFHPIAVATFTDRLETECSPLLEIGPHAD